VRQTIIFALVLNLAAVALAPVLACAVPPSRTAQIQTATMQCDGMDMADGQSQPSIHGQSALPCCVAGQVPRPTTRNSPGKPLVAIARLDAANGVLGFIIAKQQIPALQEQSYSPPELQSLFCTFLV